MSSIIQNFSHNLRNKCIPANLFLLAAGIWAVFSLSLSCFYKHSVPILGFVYAIVWIIFWLCLIWLLCVYTPKIYPWILSIGCTIVLVFFTISMMFGLMGEAFTAGVLDKLSHTTITSTIYK